MLELSGNITMKHTFRENQTFILYPCTLKYLEVLLPQQHEPNMQSQILKYYFQYHFQIKGHKVHLSKGNFISGLKKIQDRSEVSLCAQKKVSFN